MTNFQRYFSTILQILNWNFNLSGCHSHLFQRMQCLLPPPQWETPRQTSSGQGQSSLRIIRNTCLYNFMFKFDTVSHCFITTIIYFEVFMAEQVGSNNPEKYLLHVRPQMQSLSSPPASLFKTSSPRNSPIRWNFTVEMNKNIRQSFSWLAEISFFLLTN